MERPGTALENVSSWSRLAAWLEATTPRTTAALATFVYALSSLVYATFASTELFEAHTPYNHFSHLAHAWINGNLDLVDGAPTYARNNDFAVYEGRTYVTFPPFPALVLLPFVWIAGEPELVRDGQVFLWLAGLGPTLLFLALQQMSRLGHTQRTTAQNLLLAFCFAFGSVYFFTAVQGTVWFAAHVVGAVLAAAYLYSSIAARYPMLAGLALGLGFLTRAPLLFAVPVFVFEAVRVSLPASFEGTGGQIGARLLSLWRGIHKPQLFGLLGAFAIPVAMCVGFSWWHNAVRFDDAFEPGYRYLTVAWQARMNEWGLFHYHYLAKNLGVVLTSLPWLDERSFFRINVHGLALWFTTPLYFWLLWPRVKPWLHLALWLTVLCVALPTLFYQNTGWAQFGYRFSNDYAVFLFALLAVGMRPLRTLFCSLAVWALLVNAFGAATFQRKGYEQFYYWQGSQKTLYQPD